MLEENRSTSCFGVVSSMRNSVNSKNVVVFRRCQMNFDRLNECYFKNNTAIRSAASSIGYKQRNDVDDILVNPD